jgi:hypothetical protein
MRGYAYVDAIKTYERIAEKGYKSVDLFQKLETLTTLIPNSIKLPNGMENCLL